MNDGTWYKVESSLITKLKLYLDACCVESHLAGYAHAGEGEYNEYAATLSENIICLDRKNIAPSGQKQVEPCDLLDMRDSVAKFVHVKVSTQSASLSHLFSQGLTSIELLRDEPNSIEKMQALVRDSGSDALAQDFFTRYTEGNVCVHYAIVTHKDPNGLSDNLPLFSRLSLARTLKLMNRMSVQREFSFISDMNPTTAGKKKKRKKNNEDDPDAVVDF